MLSTSPQSSPPFNIEIKTKLFLISISKTAIFEIKKA
nr:MAG TPA: hypothetical protein [Caudoviricetes sp.]